MTATDLEPTSNPVEVAELLAQQPVTYAPGGPHVYQLGLVTLNASEPRQYLVAELPAALALTPIVIVKPWQLWQVWDSGWWKRSKFPEDVYPAIIAVLAALGWAGNRQPVYTPLAAREFDMGDAPGRWLARALVDDDNKHDWYPGRYR